MEAVVFEDRKAYMAAYRQQVIRTNSLKKRFPDCFDKSGKQIKAFPKKSPKKEKSYIYALIDPRDKMPKIWYVGKTNDPKIRLAMHIRGCLKEGVSARAPWIMGLAADGVFPKMEILEVCAREDWKARERYWIALLTPPLNRTAGGEQPNEF